MASLQVDNSVYRQAREKELIIIFYPRSLNSEGDFSENFPRVILELLGNQRNFSLGAAK